MADLRPAAVSPDVPAGADGTTDAGTRGRLDVRDRVYTRVAAAAAREVPGVVPVAGTLDALTGRELPRVDAHVAGDRVRLQVDVALRWPAPLAERTAAVRDHVAAQVARLTGARVDAVDVTVSKLVAPHDAQAARTTERRVV